MSAMTRTAWGLDSDRDIDWRARAACRRYDPDMWTSADLRVLGTAIWICTHECPVRNQCLTYAMANVQKCDGAVYGGVYFCRPSTNLSEPVRQSGRQPRPIPNRRLTNREFKEMCKGGSK